MAYRQAWAEQEAAHADVLAGAEERLLLVEHPPVITYGRRPEGANNLVASAEQLERMGVEVVHSDRGGDITFHGPGQIVAYPIVRLVEHGLTVGGYVKKLEEAVVAALAKFGIAGELDPSAIGVWVKDHVGRPAKVCALGVRIKRGVSMHGIALNVTTDLRFFNLIVPCGLTGKAVTSMQKLLDDKMPGMEAVKGAVVREILGAFAPSLPADGHSRGAAKDDIPPRQRLG